jgi:anti-anti-sigma regulatory factor
MSELDVTVHRVDPALVVHLTGTLDGTLADDAALREAVAALSPSTSVLFDLREVGLLSAAGRRALLAVAEGLADRDVRCAVLVDPAGPTSAALRIAALPAGLEVFDTVEDAPPALRDALVVASGRPPPPDDQLAEQFAELTRLLLDVTTVGTALERIVHAGLSMVSGADMVSVTLHGTDGRFFTPAGTDTAAETLDEEQYRSGRGPCVDAALPDGAGFAASDDLSTEIRWPSFAARAGDLGFASVLSTDLNPRRPTALGGALNIYSKRVKGLDARARRTALLLAAHASLALAYTTAVEVADLRDEQLRRAIGSRDVIGQAKGILMARGGMTADEAFDVLRRTSQDLNVKLVDLARTLAGRADGLDGSGKRA